MARSTHSDQYESDVFISYSRKNSKFVDKLVADLKDHNIAAWVDRLEIEVGDQPRTRIEDAIDKCRYFCLVISDASMKSYYVRKIEIETAFTKLIDSKREDFILPLLRQKPTGKLPLMLRSIHYLDFRSPMLYKTNISKLAKKIQLPAENFTGEVVYKNISTSAYGHLSGMGEIDDITLRGTCVKAFFHDGLIRTAEFYAEGKEDAVKGFVYDEKNRVREIVLFRDNKVVDTWQYHYDEQTGVVTKKLIIRPGQSPHLEELYDKHGNKVGRRSLSRNSKRP